MCYDRHPVTVEASVPRRADEAVPAYCPAPEPAPVPAAAGELSPIDQMYAYYAAA